MFPGPFAPFVTQHPYDSMTDGFSVDRAVRVVAQYPASPLEQDNPAGDVVTADLTLLVTPDVVVSEYDEWTAADGVRYKVDGAPGRFLNPHTGAAITRVNLRRIT